VYVPETYLWPGIVGGIIMGVGFIIGGFCPGTSLVSASTLKIDGIVFVLGAIVGVWAFGETVDPYWQWWNTSGYYGRLTLMDVFNLPTGAVVLLVVFMALFMFWGGEQLERIFGGRNLRKEPKLRIFGAVALVALAVSVIVIGTPGTQEKYAQVAITRTYYQKSGEEKDGVKVQEAVKVQMSPDQALQAREMQIEPAELFTTLHDQKIEPVMLDVRPEVEYNLFHIRGALNVPLGGIRSVIPGILSQHQPNKVYILISNDETAATTAWKTLVAENVSNVYILEGGLNNWIAFFGADDPNIAGAVSNPGLDQPGYIFPAALGDRYECSDPDPVEFEELEYTAKIQLELKRDKSGGGCG
jgi:rhodanese-related sulfurtransferase